jgi:hypothetical protein
MLRRELAKTSAPARQEYQRCTTWSFFGSAGLLLLADMAHATIIAATMSIYAPRANLPSIAAPPWLLVRIAKGWRRGRSSLIFG